MSRNGMPTADALWATYFGEATSHECYAGCNRVVYPGAYERAHIVAVAAAGANSIENLRPTCRRCNRDCSAEHLFDFMKRIAREPSIYDPVYNAYVCAEPSRIVKYAPRKIRYDAKKSVGDQPPVGVLAACTGAGKSAIAIELIGRHLHGGFVVWLTEHVDVLNTQFTVENIASWIAAGFLPRYTNVYIRKEVRAMLTAGRPFQPTSLVVCNVDLISAHLVALSTMPGYLGFVFDEVQSTKGKMTHGLLQQVAPLSRIRLGISATPPENVVLEDIFGTPPRFLLEYSILEAWRDGVCRRVEIKYCNARQVKSGGDGLGISNPEKIVEAINAIAAATTTRKGILWCHNIAPARKWARYLAGKIPGVVLNDAGDNIKKFIAAESNTLIVLAEKLREGVDVPFISYACVIGAGASARAFLQRLGRVTRADGSGRPAIYGEFLVTATEEEYVSSVAERIIDAYHGIRIQCDTREFFANRPPTPTLTAPGTIRCAEMTFELLDGLNTFKLFDKDAQFITRFMERMGINITWAQLRSLLAQRGIRSSAEAEKFFDACAAGGIADMLPDLAKTCARWWGIAREYFIDWNDLLGIISEGCYTFTEACAVIAGLLAAEGCAGDTPARIYHAWTKKDLRLPIEPLAYYRLRRFGDLGFR